MSHLIPAAQTRRTDTPNASMRTLASPTLGGSSRLSMWRLSMDDGQRGPLHAFDSEQVLTVLAGGAAVTLGAQTLALEPGDTVVLPAGEPRQIASSGSLRAIVACAAHARASVPGEDGDRGTPPWVA